MWRARVVLVVMAALAATACTPDFVIPSEEEAAAAGRSAAAAAEAFSGVFEEALDERKAELAERFEAEGEPLFPSTTADPLDGFEPLNECRWSEAQVVTADSLTLTLPAFVSVRETIDGISEFHSIYDYGRCAPITGDVQVIASATDATTVIASQVSAYRAIGSLEVVADGPVELDGATGMGRLTEIRTGGDLHSVFLAGAIESGVVLLTVHVPLDRWVETSEIVLDLLRGLALR